MKSLAVMLTGLFLPLSQGAYAQFTGDFAPENWTFSKENADASIDLSQIPNAIIIKGGNDGEEGNTDYTITFTQAGDIKFAWTFFSTDVDGASFDPSGYVLNDVFTALTDPGGPPDQSGVASVTVADGDVFAFRVYTTDGVAGPGILTIDNFTPFKNATPTLDNLTNLYIGVNEAPFSVDLTGITSGIAEPAQTISITATSSDTDILPDPTVTYSSPDMTGSLLLSPVTDAFGTATITVTVSDDGGTGNGAVDNVVKTFMVDINSNFPPQMTALNNLTLPISAGEQTVNLTGINAGKNNNESQTITVSASSSNEAIVSNSSFAIEYTSPDDNGILRFTPNANVTGQTTVTVTLMDDGGTANNGNDTFTTTFVVKINPNQTPSVNEIDDRVLGINAPEQTVAFDGISDGDGNTQDITVTATSDNTALIPDPAVTYTSPGTTGELTFTPVADQFGMATVTVTVQDNGGTAQGSVDITTTTFKVQVSGNFAPTLNELDDMIIPINDGLQNVGLNGIAAGPGETQVLTVTASSDNTELIPDPTVTYTSPDGTGSIAFTPATDMSGTATITVTVQDDGGTDNGGIDMFSQTFTVQVTSNLPPTIDELEDLTINRNSGEQTINLEGISAGPGETQDLTIEVTSDNLSLVSDFTLTYTPNDPNGSFSFTPVQDQFGVANISVTVTDNGGTDNNGINSIVETFELTVNKFVNYSASTTGNPNFQRPIEGNPPASTNAGDHPYHVQPFIVSADGEYHISIINANYDPFIAIYETNFNPSAPLNDVLSANDDDFIGNLGIFPLIMQELVAGRQYFIVTTSSNIDDSGDFTAEIAGQGDVSLGTLPTLNFLEDITMEEDIPTTINLTGITDGLGGTQSLDVIAAANNSDLFSDIPVTQNDETGSFSLSPLADANGEATITVTVRNNGIEFERSFSVTVNAVNDSPEFTLDQSDITVEQEFADEVIVSVIPEEVPADETDQVVVYSLEPSTSDLVNIQIDQNTGAVTITSIVDAFGSETFTITANDQESVNNTATQTFTIDVEKATGINDEFLSRNTNIWPNPSAGVFHLSLEMPTLGNLDIFVTDLAGKIIKHHQVNPVNTKVETNLDLTDVKSGLYLVRIKTADKRQIIKRLVKK
ncbi:T9SS type A sorting domain-containing protein [Fulvivirgaceae bacterium BMA12]|uniref:T9SS type A sorting domain-containing protein n=2 Tax=Agaribacillus aureus TaxID=3051825 RepID=A0ABT8L0U2_9BACT|nr:T9SS type A sorting domain-containing protein [Fulvivirgaceae bacterium BMA12]